MKIKRDQLLAVLKTAAPALSSNKNLVEVLSYFWFDGETVSAYDDIIGIQVGFPQNEFTGGVSGDKLVRLLENSTSDDVVLRLSKNGQTLEVNAGSAFVDFPLKPVDDCIWHPESPDSKPYKLKQDFLDAVSFLAISLGMAKVQDVTEKGVTLIPGSKCVDMYTTDVVSLSWVRLAEAVTKSRIILSTPFCDLMTKIMPVGADIRIYDDESGGGVYCESDIDIGSKVTTSVLLFGKLILDPNPEDHDFPALLESMSKGKVLVDIPQELKGTLDRASVFDGAVNIGVEEKDKVLFVHIPTSEANAIRFDETLELDEDHPEVETLIEPQKLRLGLEGRDKISILNDAVVLTGPDNYMHIVASKG